MTRPDPAPSQEKRAPWARPWAWFLGLFLCLLPALLRAGFALDDRELLFENPVTGGALGPGAAFTRDYFHHLGDSGQWRPLASLSLALDRSLFGQWAAGYHLVNGWLHLGVVLCAAGLLRKLRFEGQAARLGLVLFALHPVLADSVVWIAGRTSMLGALFPLAGAWASLVLLGRGRLFWALVCAQLGLFAGLLAKEDPVVFAVLLPCLAFSISRRAGFAFLAGSAFTLLLWCLGRQWALGSPFPTATSPVLGGRTLLERMVVGGHGMFEAVRLVVWPVGYPPQYREAFLMSRANVPFGPGALAILAWCLASAPFVWLAARRKPSVRNLSLAFAVLAFLPVAQLVPAGEIFAPRFLYLPLLFAVPALGALLKGLLPVVPVMLKAGILALVLATGMYQRAYVYRDTGTWRAEMLRYQSEDVPSWNALGLWHEEEGDEAKAIEDWRRAIELDPRYSRSWSNLGRLQLTRGELAEAQVSLRAALRAGPRNPIPRVNLATLFARQGDHARAAQLYRRATELGPGLGPAWRGLGSALGKIGQWKESRTALQRALELDPGDRAAQTLLQRLPTSFAPPSDDSKSCD